MNRCLLTVAILFLLDTCCYFLLQQFRQTNSELCDHFKTSTNEISSKLYIVTTIGTDMIENSDYKSTKFLFCERIVKPLLGLTNFPRYSITSSYSDDTGEPYTLKTNYHLTFITIYNYLITSRKKLGNKVGGLFNFIHDSKFIDEDDYIFSQITM